MPPPLIIDCERHMKTVLIVEDDHSIACLIRDYLERASFGVLLASDGGGAIIHARADKPDLIVLDLGLPGRDGLDALREIRRFSDVPVVIVTARGDETDRIVGLELGADDYIVKPFSPRELVARVRAVLRRGERSGTETEIIRIGDVTIDREKMRVEIGGEVMDLTPTEYGLVVTLAAAPGRVFTRGQLLDAVHGVSFESYERAIDAHIKNIRRKIEPAPADPRYILTVHGVGYRFADDPG